MDTYVSLAQRALDRFDDLVEGDASLRTVLSAGAEALDCPVGICFPTGSQIPAEAEHHLGPPPAGSITYQLPNGVEVWALSPELDRHVIRRFALAAKNALTHWKPAAPTTRAHLNSLISPGVGSTERRRALQGLRLRESTVITMAALSGPDDSVRVVIDQLRAQSEIVHTTSVEGVHLCLILGHLRAGEINVPAGTSSATSLPHPAAEVATAWREARIALRCALPSSRSHGPYSIGEAVMLSIDQLGGYALLADKLDPADIDGVLDVQRLDELCCNDNDQLLRTLEAVAATDSIRKAAHFLHMHHNSVARRVERAEETLGFSITEPYGRTRLFLALTLRRLRTG